MSKMTDYLVMTGVITAPMSLQAVMSAIELLHHMAT